jgi:hypothetical protein
VRRPIREILATGTVSFSSHALDELHEDKATAVDATNVRSAMVPSAEAR